MKKYILIAITVMTSVVFTKISAQEQNDFLSNPKNEIKINALYPFFAGAELVYERYLSADISVGTTVFAEYDPFRSFTVSPFARYYTGKQANAGFFVEGNALVSQKNNQFYDLENDKVAFGGGVALGYKYVTRSRWVFEANLGGGNANSRFLMRAGLMVGRRF
ncbi:MAG: DUF3575 domain-containing protein [Capnocytophaga sp.]|nr:DUF3575 domain-containing protein [Capnocytophaga sp.]